MFAHLRRGLAAGALAGVAYGAFVALVARPLVAAAEAHETGAEAAAVSDFTAAVGSTVGGLLWGLLLGLAAFGVAHYLLEPALPGDGAAHSVALAAAGFVTVSGAPWLVLPPQPPGVEHALPTDARAALYGAAVVAGAVACALSSVGWRAARPRGRGAALVAALAPFVALVALAALARALFVPGPPAGPVPDALAASFRATVVFGQAALWACLAAAHAWLGRLDAFAPPRVDAPGATVD